MKILLAFSLALLLLSVYSVEAKELDQNQKQFILRIAPVVLKANKSLLEERSKIIQLEAKIKSNAKLNESEELFLSRLAAKYKVNAFKMDDEKSADLLPEIGDLLKRMDEIPPKLMIAQAIIESGWGKSKFAKDCNNFFGVHCYSEGCGKKPVSEPDAKFEVKSYPDLLAGIEDYLHILNTLSAYEGLRQARFKMRQAKDPLDAAILAGSLSRYSQKGEECVKLIRSVISEFLSMDLQKFIDDNQKP